MDDQACITVNLYGPQPEIDRFRRWFLVKDTGVGASSDIEIDFTGVFKHQGRYNHALQSHGEVPFDFEEWTQKQKGCYSFRFDTWAGFPEELFGILAELFPHLMFDCEYIASDDSEMGYGWYNGPKDGEAFGYYPVPEGFWDSHTSKRDEASDALHMTRIDRISRAAREASERAEQVDR